MLPSWLWVNSFKGWVEVMQDECCGCCDQTHPPTFFSVLHFAARIFHALWSSSPCWQKQMYGQLRGEKGTFFFLASFCLLDCGCARLCHHTLRPHQELIQSVAADALLCKNCFGSQWQELRPCLVPCCCWAAGCSGQRLGARPHLLVPREPMG